MLLENKNALIYGGGGSIGGAIARAFAREGAKVFLAGRTLTTLEEVAKDIRSAGGVADTAQVDALDEQAVDKYVDAVAASAGSIDVSFNLISYGDVLGYPASRDAARSLRAADHERCENAVPDLEGGRATHDRAGIGGDPHVRWRRWP